MLAPGIRLIGAPDIKDDNIMVTIEDDSMLKDIVQYYETNSQPRVKRLAVTRMRASLVHIPVIIFISARHT